MGRFLRGLGDGNGSEAGGVKGGAKVETQRETQRHGEQRRVDKVRGVEVQRSAGTGPAPRTRVELEPRLQLLLRPEEQGVVVVRLQPQVVVHLRVDGLPHTVEDREQAGLVEVEGYRIEVELRDVPFPSESRGSFLGSGGLVCDGTLGGPPVRWWVGASGGPFRTTGTSSTRDTTASPARATVVLSSGPTTERAVSPRPLRLR